MKYFLSGLSKGVVWLLALFTVFPFLYMVIGSLSTHQEMTTMSLPKSLQFTNYQIVVQQIPLGRYFLNTLLVASVITVLTLATSILAAFVLTHFYFKHQVVIMGVIVLFLMIPDEIILFTNYSTILQLGLLNTYLALIVPFTTSVTTIFYLMNYLKGVSLELFQVAQLAGATHGEYLKKVLLPMSLPALVTIGLLKFISMWNAFLWPLLVTNDVNHRVLNTGLTAFTSESGTDTQLQLAAGVLTMLPILLLYLLFFKRIIKGISNTTER